MPPKASIDRRRPDPRWVHQVASDAIEIGTNAAARKHKINKQTVIRYKKSLGGDVTLPINVTPQRVSAANDLYDDTVDLLHKITAKIAVLIDDPAVTLPMVVQAYKVLSDRVAADRLTKSLLDEEDEITSLTETVSMELEDRIDRG